MARTAAKPSTGLPGLDAVFQGIMPGDSIVWQMRNIDDYRPFIEPFCRHALAHGRQIIYFRHAYKQPALTDMDGVTRVALHPDRGFEPFVGEVYRTINSHPPGTYYLFDSLSQLTPDWRSDRMLGNLFLLARALIKDHGAVAYFALRRNYHSFHTLVPISTARIVVDAYWHRGKLYIHPVRVSHRHSTTIYMLHVREGDRFVPVSQSYVITEIHAGTPWSRLDTATHSRGVWSRTFDEAFELQQAMDHGEDVGDREQELFEELVRMVIAREGRMFDLARRFFALKDIINIRSRMVSTGSIGGKSVGMLLARAILRQQQPEIYHAMELHDSFFIGSDAFYTFLVVNNLWWEIQEEKRKFDIENTVDIERERVLQGEFPDYIVTQLADMLDYFGQSSVIVRSSSLMEDSFGNAFAGKYESVFCANQGKRTVRLQQFLDAVRTVYASAVSHEAFAYRARRGMLDREENMGLLIQRVSGSRHGRYFYPHAAGVGFSFNPYVWDEKIDPEAGMLRIVFGVGTRAVDRADDDYTRIVALNAPVLRADTSLDEVRSHAQKRVDVIDLKENALIAKTFEEVVENNGDIPIDMFVSYDASVAHGRKGVKGRSPVLTFDRLLSQTRFVEDMRNILRTLRDAYQHPVDVEFTMNILNDHDYTINIVQCRPLHVRGTGTIADPPTSIAEADRVLESLGPVIGQGWMGAIDYLVYVRPSVYSKLPMRTRYQVARVIGKVCRKQTMQSKTVMLMGPGRWGTTSPSLGVPVSFAEIHTAAIVCEIVTMHETLTPDASMGTHFFSELVENNMLYMAVDPKHEGHVIDWDFFEEGLPDHLAEFTSDFASCKGALKFVDLSKLPAGESLRINANTLKQRVICYRKRDAGK